jgi:periplasmic divalent cation tolerance protein
MDDFEVVVVLTTFPIDGDVTAFATGLVRDRFAACVSVLSAGESVYRWEGAIEQARERQLILKTTADRVGQLRQRVAALHPYDTPEFLVLSVVDGEVTYLNWVRDATRSEPLQETEDPSEPSATHR